MTTKPQWILHLISNTHWDREWYMGLERYRWRLVKLMDRLLAVYAEQPDFHAFTMDGQVCAIMDYLEVRPEQRETIARHVRDGRLLIGPWYTQPNETLASGEGLIRNLLLGIRVSQTFGAVMRVSYIIDEFGHISQLPQLMRGFDIADAVAWRGIPRESPAVFDWQAPDGSRVAMFFSNDGYGHATALPVNLDEYTVTLDYTPRKKSGLRARVQGELNLRVPHATTPHLLCLNGIDHSFVQEDLPAVVAQINTHCPGVQARQSTLGEYIAAVKQAHEETHCPYTTQVGELIDPTTDVLLDVHSLRPKLKRANALTEGALEKWAEPFAVFAWLSGTFAYPRAELRKAWEYLILNHTHDSIACSSMDSVYRHVMERYAWADDIITDVVEQSTLALCRVISLELKGNAPSLVVFNPLSWSRNSLVHTTIDVPCALGFAGLAIFDAEGECPCEILGVEETHVVRFNPLQGHPTVVPVRRYQLCFAPGEIPALGYKHLTIRDASIPPALIPVAPAPNVLENACLRITVQQNGTFDVLDKATGACYAGCHAFADGGEAGYGFVHQAPPVDEVITSHDCAAEITITRQTALETVLDIALTLELPAALAPERDRRASAKATCRILTRLTLANDSRRLDIDTTITNQAKDHRLRVLFPTDLATAQVHVAQPFDVVAREFCQLTTQPQQLFVDMSDGERGIMLANIGIYEYQVLPDARRTLALTLLRCTDRIDDSTFATPDFRMNLGQNLGETTFSYSLIPHAGGWQNAYQEAHNFRYPLRAVFCRELEEEALPSFTLASRADDFATQGSFLQLEPSSITISAVKQHEERDTIVVRLFNHTDTPTQARLRLTIPGVTIKAAFLVNLGEVRQEQLTPDAEGWVSFTAVGKGLVTLEFEVGMWSPA